MKKLKIWWRVLTGQIDVPTLQRDLHSAKCDAHYFANAYNQLKFEWDQARAPLIAAKGERDEFEAWKRQQSKEIGDRVIADMHSNPQKYLP